MLEQDIREAIEANLTAEVGKRLQARLEKIDTLEKQAKIDLESLNTKNEELKKLRETCASYANIAKREEVLKVNEAALTHKEWELKVKEARWEGRDLARQDNLAVVMAVFANNRIKYSETANVPAGTDQYGNPRTSFVSKDATMDG